MLSLDERSLKYQQSLNQYNWDTLGKLCPTCEGCLVAPCDQVPLCHSVPEAIEQFKQQGFTLLSPEMVGLEDNDLTELWAAASSFKEVSLRRGSDGVYSKLRYSLNSYGHVHDERWRSVGVKLLDEGHAVSQVIDEIAELNDPNWRRWAFHSWGGDGVLPHGPGQSMHSDWHYWDTSKGSCLLACSVFTEDSVPHHAPIAIRTSSGEIYLACLPRGSILIRDINVAHCGTYNHLEHARILPCCRIMLFGQICNLSYDSDYCRPTRNVKSSEFNQWFPTEWLQKRFEYVWHSPRGCKRDLE